jgi:hypothetical protein
MCNANSANEMPYFHNRMGREMVAFDAAKFPVRFLLAIYLMADMRKLHLDLDDLSNYLKLREAFELFLYNRVDAFPFKAPEMRSGRG